MADKKARDVMSADCTCIGENESLAVAAKKMGELDVGALPICGDDDRLKGMLTDRDIVVNVIAEGKDPWDGESASSAATKPVTIGADDSI